MFAFIIARFNCEHLPGLYGLCLTIFYSIILIFFPSLMTFLTLPPPRPPEPGFELGCGLLEPVKAGSPLCDLSGSGSVVLGLSQSLTSPISNSWEKRADWPAFRQMFTVSPNQLCWGGARCQGPWGWREARPGQSTPASSKALSERQAEELQTVVWCFFSCQPTGAFPRGCL